MNSVQTICAWAVFVSLFASAEAICQDGCADNELVARWQFKSFYNDASIEDENVLFAESTPDGSVWLAASRGLIHFDGYHWTRYTTDHGLPSNHVRCVCLASDGQLWVGTENGAGVFDGQRFDHAGTDGQLAGPSVRRIVEDPSDGTLWFCCDQWPNPEFPAGLTRMRDGEFTTWRSGDGLPSDYVSDYFRDSAGRQFVLTNRGLAQFDGNTFRRPLADQFGVTETTTYVWSIVESSIHGVVAATDDYFYMLEDGQWRRGRNSHFAQPKLCATKDGEIYTMRIGSAPRLFRWNGGQMVAHSNPLIDIGGGLQFVVEDSLGGLWFTGFEKLMRWERQNAEWTHLNQVSRLLLKDSQGGIWFEAKPAGLVRWQKGQWTSLPDQRGPVVEDLTGAFWMHSDSGINVWRKGHLTSISTDQLDMSEPMIVGCDRAGTVWITGKSDGNDPCLASFDGISWQHHLIEGGTAGSSFCQTEIDPESGIWCVVGRNRLPPFRLIHVTAQATDELELPNCAHMSSPPVVSVDSEGTIWISGFFGVKKYDHVQAEWQGIDNTGMAAFQVLEWADSIWYATSGEIGGETELIQVRQDQRQVVQTLAKRIVGVDDHGLYLATHGQLEILHQDLAVATVLTPFEQLVTKVVRDEKGGLWMSTGRNVYRYRPDVSRPETEIIFAGQSLSYGDQLMLQVRGVDRFQPRDIKRNFLLSVQVDDEPWRPWRPLEDQVRISNLSVGSHRVAVRVQNANGLIDAESAVIQPRVRAIPLQERGWFLPLVSTIGLVVVLLSVVASTGWLKFSRLAANLQIRVAEKTSALRTNERKYRMLFEESQDAVLLFSAEGELLDCNRSARRLLRLNGRDLCLSDVFIDADQQEHFQQMLAKNRFVAADRYQICAGRGKTIQALVSANERTNDTGSSDGFQVIIHDITLLVQLQDRLRERQKMDALGRMAGGVAHDFNNFLAIIMYGADLIKFKSDDQRYVERGLQTIAEAVERGKTLTSQIQVFNRTPFVELKTINTREAVANIDQLTNAILPDNVVLDLDVDDDLGHILADVQQLEQVLINLFKNACHAMPDGGRIRFRGKNITLDQTAATAMRIDNPGQYVQLQVADTGSGMTAETIEKAFDPFYTTKPAGQGTGLGLAIVYGIMRQFGGHIKIRSQPGEGSVFDLFFPRQFAAITKTAVTSPKPNPMRGGYESILIVDDETPIRELARDSLQRLGYSVATAQHGMAAQELIENTSQNFDLIISDIMMPGINGIELISWLRQHRPHTSVLLISGFSRADADAEKLTELGASFLKKPFAPELLAARVREILDQPYESSAETPARV